MEAGNAPNLNKFNDVELTDAEKRTFNKVLKRIQSIDCVEIQSVWLLYIYDFLILLKKLLAFFHDHDQLDVSVDSTEYADDALASLGNLRTFTYFEWINLSEYINRFYHKFF